MNYGAKDSGEQPEEPEAKRFKKEEVWARFVDGQFYRAKLESQTGNQCTVTWNNGERTNTIVNNEDICLVEDFPEDEMGYATCKRCNNTGFFTDISTLGRFYCDCDFGVDAENQQEQDLQANQQADRQEEGWDSWIRVEIADGTSFAYKNTTTGEMTHDLPPILRDTWEKRVFNGGYVYVNKENGDVSRDLPEIVYSGDGDDLKIKSAMEEMRKRIDYLISRNQRVPLTADEDAEVEQLTLWLHSSQGIR